MASIFISRSIHSLIASRDTTLGPNIAWGGITKRAEPNDHKVAGTVFWVLVAVNVCILVPVFFVVSKCSVES